MAVVAHVFPKFDHNALIKNLSVTADSLSVLLIHSTSPTYTWNSTSQAHQYVSDFLGGSGGGALTEEAGTGYSRQALSGVSISDSGAVTTLTCANPSWANSTISATYAAFFDNTPSTDATRFLLCYWDFGGTQATTASTFTLTVSGTGLITWTSS